MSNGTPGLLNGFNIPRQMGVGSAKFPNLFTIDTSASSLINDMPVSSVPVPGSAGESEMDASQITISSKLVTFVSLPYNANLKNECLAFAAKVTPNFIRQTMGDMMHTAMETNTRSCIAASLGDVNRCLRRDWDESLGIIQRAATERLGDVGTLATNHRDIAALVSIPEVSWSSLSFFKDNANAEEISPIVASMSLAGIINSWTYPRPQISDNQVGAEAPTAASILGVAVQGVAEIWDYWGKNARATAKLFLILKRDPNCKYDITVPFAFHPYASLDGTVPLNERTYYDMSGAQKLGLVIPVGEVIDCNSNTHDEFVRRTISGLTPDVQIPSNTASCANSAGRLKINVLHARFTSNIPSV